ncbi:MAG: translocation/assembly module TamB domain-containing protein, partial [Acidobacteria bacterium]|nr:translocation/assembly module TamB domain-containing protein [Acidobacteriota bacterium]
GLALLGGISLAIAAFLQSALFSEMIRSRLVAALEQTTGGRVELREFAFYPYRLEVHLRGMVIHGRDRPEEPPFFSVEEIQLGWRLLSIWGLRADLDRVRLWEPRIYIAVADDGHTNLPPFPLRSEGDGGWLRQAVALRAGRLEVLRGQLRWNQTLWPLDVQAESFHLALQYETANQMYSGRLDFQKAVLASSGAAAIPSRAQVDFKVFSDSIEIANLLWQTPKSRLAAQGVVEDLRLPRLHFTHQLQMDWSELAAMMGRSGWQGNLAWRGQGKYDPQGWELSGDLGARSVRMGIAALPAIPWTLAASLRVIHPAGTEDQAKAGAWRAEFGKLEIAALGGNFGGSATAEGVGLAPLVKLDLVAQRISLPVLTKALSVLPPSLEQLPWTAALSGPVQASFKGAGENLLLRADWVAEAPKVVPPNFAPASGSLGGSYDGRQGRFEIQNSELTLRQTYLSADGWLTPQDSQMSFSVDTTDFEEVRPLARAIYEDTGDLPLRLGRAQARGLWSGGTRTPAFEGEFNLADFSYENSSWDQFSGHLRYHSGLGRLPLTLWADKRADASLAELAIDSGRLRRGSTAAEFSAVLGLEDNVFAPRSPFSLQGTLRNADLKDVYDLLRTELPVQGNVAQAFIQASGTRQAPRGQGTIEVVSGTVYQEPFDRFTAQYELQPGLLLSASRFRVEKGKAFLEGDAAWSFQTKQYQFSVAGSNLPLEEFQFLQTSGFPVHGLAEAKLSGEGTLQRPRVRGQIEVRQFEGDNGQGGTLSLNIETQNTQANVQLQANAFQSQWQGSAQILLEGAFPISANLSFRNTDLPSLLQTFRKTPETLQARADGQVAMKGELKHLAAVAVLGEVARLEGTFGEMTFRNVQPIRFQYRDRLVHLEQAHLSGYRLDLEVTGSIRTVEDPVLDLTANGEMDLSALELLETGLIGVGKVQLAARLEGPLSRPLWRGSLAVADASLRHPTLPINLSRMKGAVAFEGNRGILEDFTAVSGGGAVKLDGFVSHAAGGGWQFQVAADAENVRVRYPAGVSTTVNGRLTLSGVPESSLLSGRLTIVRENVSPGFDLMAALLRARDEPETVIQSEFLRNMRLDVELVSAADIRLETGMTRNLQADVDLQLQGTVENPILLGRIGILQGELFFAGKRYNVSRGEVSFVNPVRIEPLLSLTVEAQVQQYDISLDFTGPPERLTVSYRSDPPLPTGDILSLLVAGSSRQTAAEPSAIQTMPQIGAESLLSQALSAQIGGRLDRIFGAGRVRVDPQLAGFGQPANASVTLEQQITNNFTILYVTDVTSTRRQIIQGEWTITPRYSLGVIRDENGLIGINLQLKLRFR